MGRPCSISHFLPLCGRQNSRIGTNGFGPGGFAGGGEAVALLAAPGLVRDRHFDEASRDGGLLVVLPEVLFVIQSKSVHDFRPVHFLFKDPEHTCDFGGDFGGVCHRLAG